VSFLLLKFYDSIIKLSRISDKSFKTGRSFPINILFSDFFPKSSIKDGRQSCLVLVKIYRNASELHGVVGHGTALSDRIDFSFSLLLLILNTIEGA